MNTKSGTLVSIWFLVAVLTVCIPSSPIAAHFSRQQRKEDEPIIFDDAVNHEPANPAPIPPIPPSEAQASPEDWESKNHAVAYDPATGRSVIIQWPDPWDGMETQSTATPPWKRYSTDEQIPSEWQANTTSSAGIQVFTDPAIVSNPADWPYSAIVRLNITWPSGATGICSGVLIDPRHALTAGHCVFDHNERGWAAAVEVVPAYTNGETPYGQAHMIRPMSWTGWTDDEEYDHDMGLIFFDRPVGALTGWYGYGAAEDDFLREEEFRNSGYPGAPLDNGRTMWVRSGHFDLIERFQVVHENLSYYGQSGSGYVYEYDPDYWRVYAVASHYHQAIDGNTMTYCPRITSFLGHGKLIDINNWIWGHTPDEPDLMPLDFRVTPTSIEVGQPFSSARFLLHNYSSREWNGSLAIDVYLSTDSTISAADELIYTDFYQGTIKSKDWVRWYIPEPLTIPEGKEGAYYVGAIVNVTDSDTSNNASVGWDAAQINVTKAKHRVYLPAVTRNHHLPTLVWYGY